MYTINQNPINSDHIADATLGTQTGFVFFLNSLTGEIDPIPLAESSAYSTNSKYYEIPVLSDDEKRKHLQQFLYDILDQPEDKTVYNSIQNLLDKQASYQEIKKHIQDSDESVLVAWNTYIGDIAWEHTGSWLQTLDEEIGFEMHACGDCAICSAMQDPNATEDDILDAFDEENDKKE